MIEKCFGFPPKIVNKDINDMVLQVKVAVYQVAPQWEKERVKPEWYASCV